MPEIPTSSPQCRQWDRVSKNLGALKLYFQKVETVKPPRAVRLHKPVRLSGPQGNVVPLTIINDPAAWKSGDFVNGIKDHSYSLSASEVNELLSSIAGLEARGIKTGQQIQGLTKSDYNLPTLGPRLIELGREVSFGIGFQLIRNVPVSGLNELEQILLYWGIAKHLGRNLICQTDMTASAASFETGSGDYYGSVLNHVTTGGHAVKSDLAAKIPMPFHSDQGCTDIVSLLSLSKSKAGGASRWVSALAIHNELLSRGRLDLVKALTSPGWWAPAKIDQNRTRKYEDGSTVWENTTPFTYHDGHLSVCWSITMYHEELEERERLGYKLSALQEEAYWAVVALANDPDFYFEHMLEPGDMEWLANHSILHSRAPIENDELHVRHLLRWWVQTEAAKRRPVDPRYTSTNNVQPCGGYRIPSGAHIELPITPPARTQSAG